MRKPDTDITMSDGDFTKLRAIVHRNTGITIGETRKTMLVSRLRRRLREVEEPSFASYISRLASDPAEMQELTNRVTTNETYFYRTPRVWDYFQDVFLPEFQARGENLRMRVWSAAASTGEEAHTIGTILEQKRLEKPGFDYSVLGTDVSSRVLDVAQKGVYNGRSIARFRKEKPDLFASHMKGSDADGYKAVPQIRARLKFKLHNLLERLGGTSPFDVVFLRNVLIYFTDEDQEKILQHVRELIKPDGVLFIGESETLNNLRTGFEQLAPIIYRPSARVSSPCA
ncbi:CheR family methyltransferase [Leisingera sp. ANG-M7]|uniref:CheR family methyltransferase n=1 Tax=Leisingera sp. ANG-M7 TaxID=1577902 RepID=UPI00068EE669|nr:protein-glutamate O-methyltransferase CheR [Leisingera sp. ANG-M7]